MTELDSRYCHCFIISQISSQQQKSGTVKQAFSVNNESKLTKPMKDFKIKENMQHCKLCIRITANLILTQMTKCLFSPAKTETAKAIL